MRLLGWCPQKLYRHSSLCAALLGRVERLRRRLRASARPSVLRHAAPLRWPGAARRSQRRLLRPARSRGSRRGACAVSAQMRALRAVRRGSDACCRRAPGPTFRRAAQLRPPRLRLAARSTLAARRPVRGCARVAARLALACAAGADASLAPQGLRASGRRTPPQSPRRATPPRTARPHRNARHSARCAAALARSKARGTLQPTRADSTRHPGRACAQQTSPPAKTAPPPRATGHGRRCCSPAASARWRWPA